MKRIVTMGVAIASATLLTACYTNHDNHHHYFEKIDTNGNGKISHQEMHNFGHAKLHLMDTNGDRSVSRAEYDAYKHHKHHKYHADHDHTGHVGPYSE